MRIHFLLIFALASAAFACAHIPQDSTAVQNCALDYIESWYTADGGRMANAIHPMLSKCRVLSNNTLQAVTFYRLISKTKEEIGKAPADQRRVEISILDIAGDKASVMVISNDFFDFLSMAKIKGSWKILNVVWDYHDDEKDQESIEKVKKAATDYIQSIYDGNDTLLASLLHPAVAIRRTVSLKKVDEVSRTWLVEQVKNGRWSKIPKNSLQISIQVLKIHKGYAVVKVTSDGGSEYLQMCFRQNKWQIVKILWDRSSAN